MFDVNLIKKPGLQADSINNDIAVTESDNGKNESNNGNIEVKPSHNSKYYFLFSILIVFLFGSIIYFYNNSEIVGLNTNKNQAFLLDDIVNIMNENKLSFITKSMEFNKGGINIDLKCKDEYSFYNLLGSFSAIIKYNIKGYHIKNNYVLDIDLPWSISKSKDFNIDLLNKELTDLGINLKQEIYNNKLIIVSNFDNIIVLIELMSELDLINNFLIDIKQVQSLPDNVGLYQVIIE